MFFLSNLRYKICSCFFFLHVSIKFFKNDQNYSCQNYFLIFLLLIHLLSNDPYETWELSIEWFNFFIITDKLQISSQANQEGGGRCRRLGRGGEQRSGIIAAGAEAAIAHSREEFQCHSRSKILLGYVSEHTQQFQLQRSDVKTHARHASYPALCVS